MAVIKEVDIGSEVVTDPVRSSVPPHGLAETASPASSDHAGGRPGESKQGSGSSEASAALRPYVPRLAADWLATRPQETARLVAGTLMSADISGFTRLTEHLATMGRRGAEELTDLLNTCFDQMIEICEAHGGDVIKFGGDALLVFFTGEDDATRACAVAWGMRAVIAKPVQLRDGATVRLGVSIGVHTGRFAFYLPQGVHRELLVTGPDVSLTLDRESAANAGEIHVSTATAAVLSAKVLGDPVDGGFLLRRSPTETSAQPAEWPAVDLSALIPAEQRRTIEANAVGEHRQAAIGFICFKHTDERLARQGLHALMEPLQRLADSTSDAAARHGVHWLASDAYADGGKVILTGGVPTAGVNDDERLLRAIREIVDEVGATGLELHAGVNRGVVFAGNLGSSIRRTYTVIGDAVNLSARLMQKAGPLDVVASQAVLGRCRATVNVTPLEPFFVKGKEAAIDAALVHWLAEDSQDSIDRPFPLIGRDAELATLEKMALDTVASRGGAVEVIGSVGTGKTRLVAELQIKVDDLNLNVVRWSCEPFYKTSPYRAIEPLLRRAVGLSHDASPRAVGTHLATLASRHAPELLPWLPLIAIPFAADVEPTRESEEILPEFRRARSCEVTTQFLSAAVTSPTVVIFEDTQWSDAASLELVQSLIDALEQGRPWMVLLTSHGPDKTAPNATALPLRPLAASDATLLARSTPAGRDIADGNLSDLLDRANGNPLFVVELMAANGSGAMEEIPDTVEALVTVRLDQFTPRDRLLLQEASVFGMDLDLSIVSAVLGEEAGDATRWVRLSSLVRPVASGVYRFGHDLFRQTIYEGLSFRRRRELHCRIGDFVEQIAEPQAQSALLAMHFDLGEQHEKAWTYLTLAAKRADELYANEEAANSYQRALSHAQHLGSLPASERSSVAESLADVRERVGALNEAVEVYALARRLACRDEVRLARLWRKTGVLHVHQSRYSAALRLYARARQRLEATGQGAQGQVAELAELAAAYAGVRFRQGRYKDCLDWADRARVEAQASKNRPCLAHAFTLLDMAAQTLGGNHGAYALRALSIYEQTGDLVGQANVLNNLGTAAQEGGRWREALDYYYRSRAIRERSGDAIGICYSNCNIAEILVDQGHADQALELLDQLKGWQDAGFVWGLAYADMLKARAYSRMGAYEDAKAPLLQARRQLQEMNAVSAVSECDLVAVELQLLADSTGQSAAGVRQQLEALRQQLASQEGDERYLLPLLRMSAVAFALEGDFDAAHAELNLAVQQAEHMGALSDLAEAFALRINLATAVGRTPDPHDRQLADNLYASLGVATPRPLVLRALVPNPVV
jgi:class 3 adenylate cyclase/tetratricopeptide (TPR) repeat protein